MLGVRPRRIADSLTLFRFGLGVVLGWLATGGPQALPLAAGVLWGCWITDVLDGPLARRDPSPVTVVGEHDLAADVTAATGAWVYLTGAGFLSLGVALGYALFVGVLWWRTRSPYVGWGLQAVPYAAMLWVSLRWAVWLGVGMVVWLLLVVVVTWPRFPHKAAEFVRGIGALFH